MTREEIREMLLKAMSHVGVCDSCGYGDVSLWDDAGETNGAHESNCRKCWEDRATGLTDRYGFIGRKHYEETKVLFDECGKGTYAKE